MVALPQPLEEQNNDDAAPGVADDKDPNNEEPASGFVCREELRRDSAVHAASAVDADDESAPDEGQEVEKLKSKDDLAASHGGDVYDELQRNQHGDEHTTADDKRSQTLDICIRTVFSNGCQGQEQCKGIVEHHQATYLPRGAAKPANPEGAQDEAVDAIGNLDDHAETKEVRSPCIVASKREVGSSSPPKSYCGNAGQMVPNVLAFVDFKALEGLPGGMKGQKTSKEGRAHLHHEAPDHQLQEAVQADFCNGHLARKNAKKRGILAYAGPHVVLESLASKAKIV
mmetsp:Transcript_35244/g.75066  ORF Transcript_35244/g.75066 Transcript_35244/m.75066 type:complete len:285 (+) Transcript_35244:248-1102(+)